MVKSKNYKLSLFDPMWGTFSKGKQYDAIEESFAIISRIGEK